MFDVSLLLLNHSNCTHHILFYPLLKPGGEFLGYFPDDLLFRHRPAGVYDANVAQRTAYTFDPINGDAKDVVSSDVYDPRERGWYQSAMDECSSDLLGTYTCNLYWTAPFIFASDGNLGITPALAFLDHTTGAPLGVTGYGFKLSAINTLLSDAVQGSTAMTAYIMEGDGMLIAVSNGADVTIEGVRVDARTSSDASIASSAKLVIDEHYRSDQTLLIDGELITVKLFEKDNQLKWYIVVTEPYDSASSDEEACTLALETDMLQISRGEIDLYLTNLIEAGELTADALRLGLVSSYTSPSVVDAPYGIQDYIFATVRNCDVTRMIYVGYEDGTFVGFHNFDGTTTFRAADGSADTDRYYYYADHVTGEATGGAYYSKVYDPRVRPWYTQAEQTGSGSFSSVFVFATSGALGLTYSVPFYEAGVLKGVVGVDVTLDSIDELLESQNEPGFGVFVFENERTSVDDAYDMIASSSNIVTSNTSRQHKAYDVFHTESYYAASISEYLNENNLVHDLDHVELADVTAEVLNYDERTLHWRMVAYNVKVGTTTGTTITGDGDDDDEIGEVLSLAATSVALLVVVLVLAVVGVMYAKKGADASGNPPMSGAEKSDSKL